jgi:hypothetical protein
MMIDDGRERMEGEGRMEGRQLSTTEDKLLLWKKKGERERFVAEDKCELEVRVKSARLAPLHNSESTHFFSNLGDPSGVS